MLTKTAIDAAIRSCDTETILSDGAATKGGGSLQIRIRATAKGKSAAWLAVWWDAGKRRSKQLGRYDSMTLLQARETFRDEITPLIQAGKNPKSVAALPTEPPTVENLFKRYVQHLEAKGARSASHIEHVLLLGKFNAADALGRLTLAADVAPADVRAPLAAAAKRGALRTADILRTYMSAAFGWGMKSANDYTTDVNYDWGIVANPVQAVPRDPRANKTRDRNLTASEIAKLWPVLGGDQSHEVLRLLILCGQRVQETVRVDGCEIDLETNLWHMPAEKTKGGKEPHTLPLPRQAVEIFTRLKELNGDGPLFPAAPNSKAERMGWLAVTHAAAKITAVKAFQPRDLRRTWKSRTHDAGVDRFTRDLIQQHAKNDTGSRHYDRAEYLPQMRQAMDKWADWLDLVLAPEQENLSEAA